MSLTRHPETMKLGTHLQACFCARTKSTLASAYPGVLGGVVHVVDDDARKQ
jgi:hypothetical protein